LKLDVSYNARAMKHRKEQAKRTGPLPILISLGALLISAGSLWESHQARTLSYESSLPELSETTELLKPVAIGEPIRVRITITNFGRTTAKEMQPMIRYEFGPANNPFDPATNPNPAEIEQITSSDLATGDHTILITTSKVNLAHDHDVAAVLSGLYKFYFFGIVPYKDLQGGNHEFHFCRYLSAPVEGADPLKLQKCSSFNYSN